MQNTHKWIRDVLRVTNEEEIGISEGYFNYFSSGSDYEDYIIGVLKTEGDGADVCEP